MAVCHTTHLAKLWVIAVLALIEQLPMAAGAPPGADRPYIGYVYPAGGRQGSTFRIKLGGQGLDGVNGVMVSGAGVTGKIVEYHPHLNQQEFKLIKEEFEELRKDKETSLLTYSKQNMDDAMSMPSGNAMILAKNNRIPALPGNDEVTRQFMARLEARMSSFVAFPASAALANITYAEITIAPDAEPGEHEIRLQTNDNVSNPLFFHVGQYPEITRKAMRTTVLQVVGKENAAESKQPIKDAEERINIWPCTVNGQISGGEVDRYRFTAHRGQKIVITALARQLIPFIADAVPGWFQPVLVLRDAQGREIAYEDDYRFNPDPTILCEIPRDGEYIFSIYDSLYRGREDFVYRITLGELPFITSIFPLGAKAGEPVKIAMKGWNLPEDELLPPAQESTAGIYQLLTKKGKFVSNRVPFVLDDLPDIEEQEPNNTESKSQKVRLPVIINGRIDKPDDWDVFQFEAKAGENLVVEVQARRLGSPLDSVIKITDSAGKLIAFNDDREDMAQSQNTHHADSYIMMRLPSDGTYFVHIGDTARHGGDEYAYRLRISAPRQDFALRVVPSSISIRAGQSASVNVYAIRQDGMTSPIKLDLQGAPSGFSVLSDSATISGTQNVTRLNIKASMDASKTPVDLVLTGTASINGQQIVHVAVPAEDRMQAFLWRHLVPAQEFKAVSYLTRREQPVRSYPTLDKASPNIRAIVTKHLADNPSEGAGKFAKGKVIGTTRRLQRLYDEGLLTDVFYLKKIAELDTPQ